MGLLSVFSELKMVNLLLEFIAPEQLSWFSRLSPRNLQTPTNRSHLSRSPLAHG
jgi:hypothetical protein